MGDSSRSFVQQIDFLCNLLRILELRTACEFFQVGNHQSLVQQRFLKDQVAAPAIFARSAHEGTPVKLAAREPFPQKIEGRQ